MIRKIVLILLALSIVSESSNAEAPLTFIYQGQLSDSSGQLSSSSLAATFNLYKNQSDFSPIWSESKTITTNEIGIFSTELGDTSPLDISLFDGTKLYLGIEIDNQSEMLPRQVISSVPYAMRSNIPVLDKTKIIGIAATLDSSQTFLGTNTFASPLHAVGGTQDSFSVKGDNSAGGIGILAQTNSDNLPAIYLMTGISDQNSGGLSGTGPLLEGWTSGYQGFPSQQVIQENIRIENNGDIKTRGDIYPNGSTISELFEITGGANSVTVGDLLIIDSNNPHQLIKSNSANSRLIAGIYSSSPGIVGQPFDSIDSQSRLGTYSLAERAQLFNQVPVAISGVVECKVTDENGSIVVGDLLVSSSLAGHAMKNNSPVVGTLLGKALENHSSGKGKIKILLTLH